MSVTTTDNPVSTALHRAANNTDHLRDYQVHLTTTNHDNRVASPAAAAETTVSNPPDWPDDYRGMPPYRPINTGLDLSTRPWGGNPVEHAFVFTMFTGVWTVANLNWLWRQTGGRINDRIFRYPVGGEI